MTAFPKRVTHVFSFWEGFSTSDRMHLGRLVAAATQVQTLVVVQRAFRPGKSEQDPAMHMRDLGFGELHLMAQMQVKATRKCEAFACCMLPCVCVCLCAIFSCLGRMCTTVMSQFHDLATCSHIGGFGDFLFLPHLMMDVFR